MRIRVFYADGVFRGGLLSLADIDHPDNRQWIGRGTDVIGDSLVNMQDSWLNVRRHLNSIEDDDLGREGFDEISFATCLRPSEALQWFLTTSIAPPDDLVDDVRCEAGGELRGPMKCMPPRPEFAARLLGSSLGTDRAARDARLDAIRKRAEEYRTREAEKVRLADAKVERWRRVNVGLHAVAHFSFGTPDLAEFARAWAPKWVEAARVLREELGVRSLENIKVDEHSTEAEAAEVLLLALDGGAESDIAHELEEICTRLGMPGNGPRSWTLWGLRDFLDRVHEHCLRLVEGQEAVESLSPNEDVSSESTILPESESAVLLDAVDKELAVQDPPALPAPWKHHRTDDIALRGWAEIQQAIWEDQDDRKWRATPSVRKALREMNALTQGPLVWVRRRPEVNRGEFLAWLGDSEARAAAADKAGSKRELRERNGARLVDRKMHREKRPNSRGKGAGPREGSVPD